MPDPSQRPPGGGPARVFSKVLELTQGAVARLRKATGRTLVVAQAQDESLLVDVRTPNDARAKATALCDAVEEVDAAERSSSLNQAQRVLKQCLELIHELNDPDTRQTWPWSHWTEAQVKLWFAHLGARNVSHHTVEPIASLTGSALGERRLIWRVDPAAVQDEPHKTEYEALLYNRPVLPQLRELVALVSSSVAANPAS